MTRCYECLEHGVVGLNMGIYEIEAIPGHSINHTKLPHHHECAAKIGLAVVKHSHSEAYVNIGAK